METNFAKLTMDQLIELAHNKSYEEILGITRYLQECIRQYFQRMLADTSEESPLKCSILIETDDSQGISDGLKPHLIGMYQAEGEGIIYLNFEGDNSWYELEYFTLDCQLDILRAIEFNDKILELWKNRKAN